MRLLSTLLAVVALASGVIVRTSAQTPADSAAYAVAYVEVRPSSRAAAIAALKDYRTASKKDDGSVAVDVFEQVGRQGHFTIVETWRDQKAFDAHSAGAPRKVFVAALEPARLSDYDQRPYKTLSIGPAPAAGDGQAVYVVSHVDTAPAPAGAPADGPGLLRRLAEASRQEPGNVRFDVVQHAMRGNHFTVIEAWQNQAALDRHAEAAHTKAYREAIAPLLGSPLDERIFKAVP